MSSKERWEWNQCKFRDWQKAEHLGSGSGGRSQVYRLTRQQMGIRPEERALKVIHLVEEKGTYEGLSPNRRATFENRKTSLLKSQGEEISLMIGLSGKPNIVTYYDYEILDWTDQDGFGTDILILMELLHAIRDDMRDGYIFPEAQIAKIGSDLAKALDLCHSRNITHRDIKPDNIFVNNEDEYKLGDFGISKVMDNTPDALLSTSIGTRAYGAPEQYHSLSGYDNRVDIYSLGLTLYELANRNRLPFAEGEYVSETGIQKRMSGMALPVPAGVSPHMADIILRACAYQPEERYQTAADLGRAIEHAMMTGDLTSSDVYATSIRTNDSYWEIQRRMQGGSPNGYPGPQYPNSDSGWINPYSDNPYPPEEPEGNRTLHTAITGFVIVDIILAGFILGFWLLPNLLG